ncbi:hypothetical protein A2686_05350 [Candidatus Woesebacteria bacterium RIFCSPHIGHO2_01_FULL_38_10]|uniref:DUF420 domain-containing protein n=1 Tax=Candidatus Woesebacteria bacterium RIFCSPLOWO2_01_FULL_39_10b TaxID=1802517 RepID=A0A1F8B7C3_9BACT|nr:MAG: hypothetical protein A2686_05350 [Candidatus Woesebacteria bacterium RIFCSPHIGHO2_01_FULL_38_10]OGM59901.1 MAG: hypothetical protein A2892_02875 [Candidatus Woesebacteria bacterium RIFCSPLOWO2_01_FULL_39_10b]
MLRNISYFSIFGKPLIMYLGILTLSSFLFTALIGFLNFKGIHKIPFKWHPRMAAISITLALIHGLLGILAYL